MDNEKSREGAVPKDPGRRALLRAATVAGGAVAASALLPGSWEKPLATVGGLPAHAQGSEPTTIYFIDRTSNSAGSLPAADEITGPPAIKVWVHHESGYAHVEALNRRMISRFAIDLNIDGTKSSVFTQDDTSCPGSGNFLPKSQWYVDGFTLGDPTIKIANYDGEGSWVVEVPKGDGILPALEPCV